MQVELAQPWFDSALERLDVRRGNRLLTIDPSISEVVALRSVVGNSGQLSLVVQDRQIAEQFAEHQWPNLTVFSHETTGGETFGTHDSILVAPRTGPLLPVENYAQLIRNNLRPGGRFVIDLPAQSMLPDLLTAWQELGWDEEQTQPLRGVTDLELTAATRKAGLRGVQSALGSHLIHASSPAELAAAFAEPLAIDEEQITELGHAIVRVKKDSGPIDALVHRTQVGGQR